MEALFWTCAVLIAYPYAIYPALLVAANRLARRKPQEPGNYLTTVTIILPVHNEAARVAAKVRNLLELDYPAEQLQILVVGDGCTDDSLARAEEAGRGRVTVVALPVRAGKAAALNAGLEAATSDVVVFTDAGILLERQALRRLIGHFEDPQIGCVSGEDYIEGGEAEGLYGRIELLLRREEAMLHSIAGASGCFYGQRRELCRPFTSGMAPDFLSVLNTVRAGRRAIAEPGARGAMSAATSQSAEFSRKVRTLLRGMTALFGNAGLLNPFRYGAFSFILWSHKVLRWLAPLPLLGAALASWLLRTHPLYLFAFVAQASLYAAALAGLARPSLARGSRIVAISAFFTLVNAAAFKALLLWLFGSRVEVWEPTRRPR